MEGNIMKKYFQYILMTVALVAAASCSNELDEVLQPAGNGSLQFVVSDFPAFGESPETRVIGTQDVGKTAWEEGDKLLLSISFESGKKQGYSLEYLSGVWTLNDKVLTSSEITGVLALYAPDCEIKSDGSIGLASGKLYGMAEYIPAKTTVDGLNVSISFKDVTRTYSRLRIASEAGQELTVTTTDFTPAGATSAVADDYTLTTDDNGNAFLYGTFAVGATVCVNAANIEIVSYAFTSATEAGVSYALETMSNYIYDDATNTYTVYTSKGLYAWSEAARVDLTTNLVLAADITLTGENNWTTIGAYDKDVFDENNTEYIGTIDGAGHTITGLNIKMEEGSAGFISVLGKSGHIKNLLFTNAEIQGGNAAVVAAISRGIVENCSVISECSVSGTFSVGGIVGQNLGLVSGCNNEASIYNSGYSGTGGIVGRNEDGTVMGCINSGSVQNSCTGNPPRCGGIMGSQFGETSTVSIACGNIGEVSSIRTDETGGVAGSIINGSTIALWTKATTESDASGDGIGDLYYNNRLSVSCHSFANASAVTAEKIAEMNAAIATYNKTATEGKTCPYTWQVGTDGYPTLVKSE